MSFQLPSLPYDFGALEPHIDARTMEIHHGKHHAAYVNNLNGAIQGTDAEGKSLEEIIKSVSNYSQQSAIMAAVITTIRLFWTVMAPNGGGEPTGELASGIDQCIRHI